ncbi:MAG TPA: carbohydrate kinase family protein [Clostridia bacterium]|nr:carbohydrate kinase family protein [Clostridia bacterium]
MDYDVLFLTAPTVDVIIEMEGCFPIQGGCTRRVLKTYPEPGGPGNILIVFNRMGGNILPVGPIGEDYYGKYLLDAYHAEHIETGQLYVTQGYSTPVANCIIDKTGVHSFISTFGSCVFAKDEDVVALMDCCRGLCLSGYNLANDTRAFRYLSMELLRRAHALKREVFFDPGPLVGEIDPAIFFEVLRKSTVIALNDEEARIATGCTDPVDAASTLIRQTDALILVKAGARGCYATSSRRIGGWFPAFQVPLVDTTGAGDSFLGAFMYAWMKRWSIKACVTFGNAAGAVKASKFGTGTQVPTLGEMVEILEKNGYTIANICKETERFA